MNILIFSWRCPQHPFSGGAEQSTFEHAKIWIKYGHRVFWFSSLFKDAKRSQNWGGVEIIRRGNYVISVYASAFFWWFFGKHPKFDLVIDEFHGIPFFTTLYVRTRILAFIHEVAKEIWNYNPWPKPLNLIPKFIGKLFEPIIFKVFYKNVPFMTVSESTKKDLINWGIKARNITVIHNGVKLVLPKSLPPKEEKFTITYLGSLSYDKGIHDAIRTFSEINRKDESWNFWVVGRADPQILKELLRLAKDLEIQDKIKFWGFVSDKRKFELLAKSHLLINPSIREGWGLVNIEANACATPVVAYKVPGIRDSVKDGKTGLLADCGDYRTLAEYSIKLSRDKKEYARLQQNAIKWSKKFSWEKSGEESLDLIESL